MTTKKNTNSTKDNLLEGRVCVSFAAIDKYVESNIVSAQESEIRGADFIGWGDGNKYPQYLLGLFKDVTLFRTIVQGIADYVVGDGVVSNSVILSKKEAEDLVRNLAIDYALYGGFAIDVERSKEKKIAKLYPLNMANIRSDKKNEFLFYSTDWTKSAGRVKTTKYPKFRSDSTEFSSIFYLKNNSMQTYPLPVIQGDGAVSIETLKAITDFHWNNMENGFTSPTVISFCNGLPSDEQKKEIEDAVGDKFCGYQNAGRVVINFAEDKEHGAIIQKIPSDDFDKKYEALRSNAIENLFIAYKASPALFGLPTSDKGFAEEQYEEQFKLFNRSVIKPIQKMICNAVDEITGNPDSIVIKPFSIDWEKNKTETVS